MNPLNDFIVDKYRDRIQAEFEEKYADQIEPELKTVSVRIHIKELATIDNIARYLDVSRQQLLSSFIEGGVSQALTSLAYASLQSRNALPELETYGDVLGHDQELEELIEEERMNFIKVLCE